MKRLIFAISFLISLSASAIDLTKATIVYDDADNALVKKMAVTFAEDIERVSGIKPKISTSDASSPVVYLATLGHSKFAKGHNDLNGEWERYAIDSNKKSITIVGSDARGLAYGVFHISEAIGVSPWYWWADIPVAHKSKVNYSESLVSKTPTIRYRGLFINDEDWGLFTWSSRNYEKELKDIGPKTYDKVCELILRLKGNMLAPAMHSCTGAFYSHPQSQVVAASWGIMYSTTAFQTSDVCFLVNT